MCNNLFSEQMHEVQNFFFFSATPATCCMLWCTWCTCHCSPLNPHTPTIRLQASTYFKNMIENTFNYEKYMYLNFNMPSSIYVYKLLGNSMLSVHLLILP